MAARYKSVETKYVEARDRTLRALRGLDRRTFFKVSAASAGAAFAKGLAAVRLRGLKVITGRERRRRWHPAKAVMGDCQAAAVGVSRCFQCQGRSSCSWEAG